MGLFSDIVRSLSTSRDGVVPSLQAFPAVDVEAIGTDLRLDARGRENALANQPSAETEFEDTAELDVRAEIERRARKGAEEYDAQMSMYDSRLRRVRVSTDHLVTIEAAGETGVADFRVQAIDDLNHLHEARGEVEGRQREFDSFRAAQQLMRLPNIVSERESIARWLVIGVLVLLEALLNGFFFAEGSEFGLIGGVVQALVLSVLNVGAAVLYARYGLPLLIHTRPTVKSLGVVMTASFVSWAVMLNVSTGHFRDLFVRNPAAVLVSDLVTRLTTAPLLFDDVKSLILTLLGLGLSVAAVIDAAAMKDLYPGFGAVGRRRTDAIAAYVDLKAQCLAGLTERRDSAIQEMSQVIEALRASDVEIRLVLQGRSRLYRDYCSYLSHLGDAYTRLLQRYYEANIQARPETAPSRFRRRPGRPYFLTEPPEPPLFDHTSDAAPKIIERMEHFIRVINQEFESAARQYHTVAGLTRQA